MRRLGGDYQYNNKWRGKWLIKLDENEINPELDEVMSMFKDEDEEIEEQQ